MCCPLCFQLTGGKFLHIAALKKHYMVMWREFSSRVFPHSPCSLPTINRSKHTCRPFLIIFFIAHLTGRRRRKSGTVVWKTFKLSSSARRELLIQQRVREILEVQIIRPSSSKPSQLLRSPDVVHHTQAILYPLNSTVFCRLIFK